MLKRFLLLVILILSATTALAESQGGYDLSWNTVNGGGQTFSTGGPYILGATIGQADAGMLSGGSYTLGGGFWGGGEVVVSQSRICLPMVLRGVPQLTGIRTER